MRPPRVYDRTTPLTISHRVRPRPSAPSLMSEGTLEKSSRLIDAVIGTIMIVSTRIAGNMVCRTSAGVPLKNGVQPKPNSSHGPKS